jgi:hypothetical protein
VYGVDDVLRAVASHGSMTLQWITVHSQKLALEGSQPRPYSFLINQSGAQLPSKQVLASVLSSRPALIFKVLLCHRSKCTTNSEPLDYDITVSEWDAAMEILHSIEALFPERMRIVHVDAAK